jgi:hypothetical protein
MTPWLLFGAAALISLVGEPEPTVVARLFFMVVLAGGLVAGLGLLGNRAQLGAAAALLALVVIQRLIARPVAEPPSNQWTATLQASQVIRHTIKPPLGSRVWQEWWRQASGAAAYVCARGPLTSTDGLQLFLDDKLVGTITQEVAFGARPEPTSIGFYRLPVTRAALEAQPASVFDLRQAAGADHRPIEVCGTSTYRPTAGLDASAFFDGSRWTSPGPTRHGRFLIELRIEQTQSGEVRPLAALY